MDTSVSVVLSQLLESFSINCILFFVTLAFALPLGLVISFGSRSRFKLLSVPIQTFVWIIRGTPLMLQIIVIYFGPGLLDLGTPWPSGGVGRITAACVAFVINYACYFSEIYRGGIEGVPVGQREAGQVLGMSRAQIFVHVTFLQVIKRILAPMGNEVVTLVKDTSLANVIMVGEVILAAQNIQKVYGIMWPLFTAGAFYLVFNGALSLLFAFAEKKLGYFRV